MWVMRENKWHERLGRLFASGEAAPPDWEGRPFTMDLRERMVDDDGQNRMDNRIGLRKRVRRAK
jgi:hypothetical protein